MGVSVFGIEWCVLVSHGRSKSTLTSVHAAACLLPLVCCLHLLPSSAACDSLIAQSAQCEAVAEERATASRGSQTHHNSCILTLTVVMLSL
jgi:hypothetical protein